MGLFKFDKNKIHLTKELRAIKVFKELDSRENADDMFAYVYHMCDWDSPYSNFNEDRKEKELKEDLLDGEEPDELLVEACEKYRELQMTPSMDLLKAAKKAAQSLKDYFLTIDPTAEDNPGKEARDLMNNLTKVGDVLNKFEEWEEILKKEQDKAQTRKGVKITKYNE